jgi:hypothetical protein
MFCSNCGFKNSENSKFCTSCGTRIYTTKPNTLPQSMGDLSDINAPNLIEVFSKIQPGISGSLCEDVADKFPKIIGAKYFYKIFCTVYASKEYIALVPHSKDRTGLALVGIILTGGSGALAVLGMAAGSAVADALSNRESNKNKYILTNPEGAVIFDTSKVIIDAYDYRSAIGFSGGEWETRISIKGETYFNGKSGDFSFSFSVMGKTYKDTFFSKANKKMPELFRILEKEPLEIKESTKRIW